MMICVVIAINVLIFRYLVNLQKKMYRSNVENVRR